MRARQSRLAVHEALASRYTSRILQDRPLPDSVARSAIHQGGIETVLDYADRVSADTESLTTAVNTVHLGCRVRFPTWAVVQSTLQPVKTRLVSLDDGHGESGEPGGSLAAAAMNGDAGAGRQPLIDGAGTSVQLAAALAARPTRDRADVNGLYVQGGTVTDRVQNWLTNPSHISDIPTRARTQLHRSMDDRCTGASRELLECKDVVVWKRSFRNSCRPENLCAWDDGNRGLPDTGWKRFSSWDGAPWWGTSPTGNGRQPAHEVRIG